MYKYVTSSLVRVLLAAVFLALLINPATAQTKKKPKKTGMGQTSAQMSRMTNKQRWEAAARHADRRAAHIRKNRGQVK